jgi:hypothetical protein
LLVGNKIDLVPEGMTMDQLLLFEHIEASAKNNVRVQEVFQMLLRSIEQARDYRAKYGVPEDDSSDDSSSGSGSGHAIRRDRRKNGRHSDDQEVYVVQVIKIRTGQIEGTDAFYSEVAR